MTDMAITAEPSRFRVGLVFSRSFALLFGDFAKFVGLAAILALPTLILSLFGVMRMTGAWHVQFRPGLALAFGVLIGFACSMLAQAVILYGAFQRMRGQGFAVGDSLKYGLARFFPIIGLLICMALAFGLASIVFALPALIIGIVSVVGLHVLAAQTIGLLTIPSVMIPVVILYLMWAVALPVCVVEQAGPGTSLGRSRALTKGYRWRILGILVLLFIANGLVQVVLTRVLGALAGPTVTSLVSFLWRAVAGAFGAIVIAVIYYQLRVAKDGIDIEHIAAVFD
jgi:hypothetical protein